MLGGVSVRRSRGGGKFRNHLGGGLWVLLAVGEELGSGESLNGRSAR